MQTVGSKRGFAKRDFAPWADRALRRCCGSKALSKRFGGFAAVDRLSLDIYQGEFFALLGPSGCGKTTLLRLIAGFERPNAGRILLDGVDLAPVPPHRRPVNMMFQSYALFPHLTVEANVAFGLKQEGLPRREIAERVADMLALVKLENFGRRKPHELSGGQRQRVALARSLVKRPRVLLLDEPMAALDKKLRGETQFELMDLQRRLGLTFIIVTHDQSEAMTVADRIAVMDRGRLMQVAPPAEIYEQPNSRWVADFIGRRQSVRRPRRRRRRERRGHGRRPAAGRGQDRCRAAARRSGSRCGRRRCGSVRARAAGGATAAENGVAATVVDIGYLGDLSIYDCAPTPALPLQAAIANTGRHAERAPSAGTTRCWLSFPPEAAIVLTR